MKKYTLILASLIGLLFPAATAVSGQVIEPDISFVSVGVGSSKDVTFTLRDDSLKFVDEVEVSSHASVNITKKSFGEKAIVLNFAGTGSLIPKTDLTLTFKLDNGEKREVKIKAAVIDPSVFSLDVNSIIDAEQGGPTKQILLNPSPEDDRVTIDSSGDLGRVSYRNGVISLTPLQIGKFGLDIKVDDTVIRENFSVIVKPSTSPLEAKSPINMKQGEEIRLENLGIRLLTTDAPPQDLSAICIANGIIEPQDDGIVRDGDKYRVTTKRLSTASFKLVCNGKSKVITVQVQPAMGKVVPSSYNVTLKRNTPERITVQVLDKSGSPMEVDKVTWEPAPGVAKAAEYSKIVEETSRDEKSISLKLRSTPLEGVLQTVQLFAVAYKGGDILKSDPIDLVNEKTFNVTGFGKLKIHLEVLEDKTTRDDFGRELMKHYFVTKATFDNNVRDSDNKTATILVFNQSIEAKAFIEYEDPDKPGSWSPVGREMVIPNLERNERNENIEFSWEHWKSNVVAKLKGRVESDKVSAFLSLPGRKITDLSKCVINEDLDYVYPYQPLRYETALLTHESRENNSFKNRLLTAALSLSSLTAFVTNLVGAGGDWQLAQDQFRNLLVPSYQKYFPDRREIHKDHLIQELMQPLLQIPFGSQESKYLLFPRNPISVAMPMRIWDQDAEAWKIKTVKRIRIRGISPSDTCATVALIKRDED